MLRVTCTVVRVCFVAVILLPLLYAGVAGFYSSMGFRYSIDNDINFHLINLFDTL